MRQRIDKLALVKTILWALTFGLYGLICPQLMLERDD